MNRFKNIFLTFFLSVLPLVCCAQARVYTMKVKLADFPAKTTKVVLDGSPEFSEAVREAVLHFWRISPYEFCSSSDYESRKKDNSLYFLRPVEKEGAVVLELSKGGKAKDEDNLKEGFEIVDLPVGDQYEHFGALIDILQNFMAEAMESDRVAYAGLKYRNGPGASQIRKLAKSNPEQIGKVVVGRYTIMYDKSTHELCCFRK